MLHSSQVPLSPASSSRVLALFLPELPIENSERVAEALLQFSPRLTFRQADGGFWFFIDLGVVKDWIDRVYRGKAGGSSGGEVELLNQVIKTASLFCPAGSVAGNVRVAIADSAPTAQCFAQLYGYWISLPGQGDDDLGLLPIGSLVHLEGVPAWKRQKVEGIIGFFSLLGFRKIEELRSFSPSAWHERWGELGDLIFRRLQRRGFGGHEWDPQPISPFVATEPLKAFVPLDFPVTVISLLIHEVDEAMNQLFARMEGRRVVVRRLHVRLRCEYSETEHSFTIEPSLPSRDRRFFQLLLENRLERIELLNPIKDIELSVDPVPEKEQQVGLLEQQTLDEQKLALLTSLLRQENLRSGFAEIRDEIWPEKQWLLNESLLKTVTASASVPGTVPLTQGDHDEDGFAPQFSYAATLPEAPRPSLLAPEPRPVSTQELRDLRFLSARPIERLESEWWEGRAGPGGAERDYYVARDSNGRNLWLYQTPKTKEFFIHGAFD